MKDDPATPPDSSPNDFERNKSGTSARSDAEAAIESVRKRGGVFVDAVRATRMPMVLTEPNLPGNPIVFANQAFLKLSGYSMNEVLGQQPHFMDGPDTDSNDAARFSEIIRSDQDDIIETVQYRKDGRRFVATVLVSAFKDADGRTLNHFMSWLDVTRRHEAETEVAELRELQTALGDSEARLRTLLAELQHRVRNTLAVVKSITQRTAESSSSVDEMAAHLSGRLDAFARVQSAMTRNPQRGIDLRSLIADELLVHTAHEGEQVTIDGPDLALKPKAAESVSLAMHELTTNAVKHGALTNSDGRIEIKWKKNGDGTSVNFKWSESNGKKIGKPSHHGFGMELLTRVLPYDLKAKTKVQFAPEGLRFSMDLPVDHVMQQ